MRGFAWPGQEDPGRRRRRRRRRRAAAAATASCGERAAPRLCGSAFIRAAAERRFALLATSVFSTFRVD